MSVPLVLSATEDQALAELRELAAANPVEMRGLTERLATAQGKVTHVEQMTAQSVAIPFGYLVTFSIETGHPCGICRHMSMSVDRAGRGPSAEAVWLIADRLGFVGGLESCNVWLEDLQRGPAGERRASVNVVQPIAAAPGGRA